MKAILIKRDKDVYWMEISPFMEVEVGMRIYNSCGGYNYLLEDDKILKTVTVEDWDDLDLKVTSGYKNLLKQSKNKKLKLGYIDRSGTFYRCEYEAHSALAEYLFNTYEGDLDNKGWIKIGGSEKDGYYVHCEKRITPEQLETLKTLKWIRPYQYESYQVIMG